MYAPQKTSLEIPTGMKTNLRLLILPMAAALAGCGTGSNTSLAPQTSSPADSAHAAAGKSAKRGIAYHLSNGQDMSALAPGVSWWYNWGSTPDSAVPYNYNSAYGMTYYPMLWDGNFDKANVESFIKAHPEIKYLLVLNEPNHDGQAKCGNTGYCSPQDAAVLWPQYEAVANDTGTQIVGPQLTFGQEPNYSDPVAWMDAFIAAYKNNNGGRAPRFDYLGFHWYDYGLASNLDRMDKYGKQIWVTEFANWHTGDSAAITTLAQQEAQQQDMVNTCETRSDVFRYAWFSGRVSPDPAYVSLLAGTGQLTGLGQQYIGLPFSGSSSSGGSAAGTSALIDAGSTTAQGSYAADTGFSGGATAGSNNGIAIPSGDTASQAVYQTNRYGNFTYTLGGFAANSTHTVKLHFAETYWSNTGQRVFNVIVNGATKLSNFDIVSAAGGANKANIQSISTTANGSGQIVIQFQAVKDNAQINAIEVN